MESAVVGMITAEALVYWFLYRREMYGWKVMATWFMFFISMLVLKTDSLNNIFGFAILIVFLLVAVDHTSKLVI